MNPLLTAVVALWVPLTGFGVLFLVACVVGRAWQAFEDRRPNPYLVSVERARERGQR